MVHQIKYLFIAALFFSCKNTLSQKDEIELNGEKWIKSSKTNYTHSYDGSGRLNKSYRIDSVYFKGKFASATKSVIERAYDSIGNLISEKTFQIFKDDDSKLDEKKTFSYDKEKNIILEHYKSIGVTEYLIRKYYNSFKQEIKRIEEQSYPEGFRDENSPPESPQKYDTTLILSYYDKQGNCTKQITCNSSNVTISTLHTIYSNKQKVFSYELDNNDDTMSVFSYKREGSLLVETMESRPEIFRTGVTWYNGNKIVKALFHDSKRIEKIMELNKYDIKGNLLENISYN